MVSRCGIWNGRGRWEEGKGEKLGGQGGGAMGLGEEDRRERERGVLQLGAAEERNTYDANHLVQHLVRFGAAVIEQRKQMWCGAV